MKVSSADAIYHLERLVPGYSFKDLNKRLERWADWARSPSMGGVGGSAGYMRERLDKAADSFEMTDEIAATERAIARTKLQRKLYWKIIQRYYLGRLSLMEIAYFFHASESRIKATYDEACVVIHRNILEIEASP